ncbi:MAG: DUF4446 family protein [Armatimonadota bacterium]|nr:DUF4446 family protein [bacterium]MDW8320387.1 DUF4446 family protein [Armatimonadota bacterium]
MSLWQGVLHSIAQNSETWIGASVVVHIVWALVLILLVVQMRSVSKRLQRLTAGATGASLEKVLVDHLARVEEVDTRQRQMEQRVSALEAQIPLCVQYVGLVRYDAFEDVGGQQSFSLAMLDALQNGMILTSVYSRTDVRVYAKAIRRGQPSHPLSEEELQALRTALSSG